MLEPRFRGPAKPGLAQGGAICFIAIQPTLKQGRTYRKSNIGVLKKFGLAAVLLVAGAAPAFAEDTCQAPPVPVAVDGTTVARDQLVAAIAAVKTYIAASDTYQQCINELCHGAEGPDCDKDKKPMDPALIQLKAARSPPTRTTSRRSATT